VKFPVFFKQPLLREWVLATGALTVLVAVVAFNNWFWRADNLFYDAALKLWQRPAPADLVIVAIDDASLAQLGRWPWRRAVHASLLDRLTQDGARAVGFDIILSEADLQNGSDDETLAAALKRNGHAVLPLFQAEQTAGSLTEGLPLPLFAKAAAGIGHVQIELDPDGIARSVYLYEGSGEARYPHLSLALLMLAEPGLQLALPGERDPNSQPDPGVWMRDFWMRIPFAGPPGHFTQVSYADVLSGKIPAGYFHNKIVLVGATATGMGDSHPTPVSGLNRPMPGVEINANIYAALRSGQVITVLAPYANTLTAVFGLWLLMLLLLRLPSRYGLLLSLAGAVASVVLAALALRFLHIWLAPTTLLLSTLLAYPIWSWRRLEATQRYLDESLQLMAQEGVLAAPLRAVPGNWAVDSIEQRIQLARHATEALRDARHFVVDTMESLPVGVVALNQQGQVALMNQRARALLEMPLSPPSATRQYDAQQLFSTLHDSQGKRNIVDEIDGTDTIKQLEVSTAADRRLLLTIAPSYAASGSRVGYIIGLADITAERQAQQTRDDLMRFVSHDIRAPLASILTLVETSAMPETSTQLSMMSKIKRYADGALNLANDFFRLVRAEAIDQSQFSLIDVCALLEEAADDVWVLANTKQIGIERDFASLDEALVLGDRHQLQRVFINLLNNAVKYSPPGTQVTLRLQAENTAWRVSIIDQGYGIEAHKLAGLFTRFTRLRAPGQPETEGVGLGLMIVKAISERHQGELSVTSRVGVGSTFSVVLPRAYDTQG
jgi:CHASE2 domain-containing sensor protein/signal transduction histidine kinase